MNTRSDRTRGHLRNDIEGLRAVAVLSVVAFHAGVPALGGGFAGVDVFYVISGYLITLLMLRDLAQIPAPTFLRFIADFYARRFKRILPAASAVLLGSLLVALVIQNPIENATLAAEARAASLFFANVHFSGIAADYFAESSPPSPFLHYWSLSLEEQFYFVWPIIAFALVGSAWRVSRGRQIAIVGLVSAASFVVCLYWMESDPIRAFYSLPARAWELGLGAMVALSSDRMADLADSARKSIVLIGAVLVSGSVLLLTRDTPFPGLAALPPVFGTALVIAAGCAGRAPATPVRTLLESRPFQLAGRYSFSLYLWHWPILVLKVEHFKWAYSTWQMRSLLMLVVAFPLSVLTYHLLENPIRQARGLRGSPTRSLILGGFFITFCLVGSAGFNHWGTAAMWSSDRSVAATNGSLAAEIRPSDFVPKNMVPSLRLTRDPLRYADCDWPCRLGPPQAAKHVVMFGDSHAGHWGSALQAVADSLQISITIEGLGGCPSYPLFPAKIAPDKRRTCSARRNAMYENIRVNPPDIVILSNFTGVYFATRPAEWEAAVRDGIRKVSKDTRLLVFSETPRLPLSAPLCLMNHYEDANRCDATWPAAINSKLQQIASEEGAIFIDLRDVFCTPKRCPVITEDHLIYADADHMTVAFSRSRAAWMASMLTSEMALQHQTAESSRAATTQRDVNAGFSQTKKTSLIPE